MRALIVDHTQMSHLRFGEAPEPVPGPHDALIAVSAVSINFGDVQDTVESAQDGTIPGWEAAGTVLEAARDGSGPPVGTSVVTFGFTGAWAQVRAVDTGFLCEVPADADLGALATVPIAGVSALAALDRIGPLLGRRVLITGATGGVGRYAVQLARRGGATVYATTGDLERHAVALRALGADAVLASPEEVDGSLDGVIDTVGGRVLVAAFERLGRNGRLIALGHVTDEPEVFPAGVLLSRPGQDNRSVSTFFMPEATDFARGMSWLSREVADGAIDPGIAWRGSWNDVTTAIDLLRSRRLRGKAVLEVAPID